MKKHQQGSWRLSVRTTHTGKRTDLGKLPPIEEVAGIVFEDKDVVDLVLMPDTARQAEEEEKEVDEEIPGINLDGLVTATAGLPCDAPVIDSWYSWQTNSFPDGVDPCC